MNTTMNLQVPYNMGNFLFSWKTARLLRKILLHGVSWLAMSKKKLEQGTSEQLKKRLTSSFTLWNQIRLLYVATCIQMKTVIMKTHNLGERDGLIQRILNLTPSQIQVKVSSDHKLNPLPLPKMKPWEGEKD